MDNSIFTIENQDELQRFHEQSEQDAQKIEAEQIKAFFYGVFFVALTFFEYHVLYTVFLQVAGQDNPYWAPSIMGFSALIMVVALHIFAHRSQQHPTIQFVDRVVEKMIPVYLLGIGLLLAVLLYKYGLSSILDADHMKLNMETLQMEGQSWVSSITSRLISPLASIMFSAGLGALAIINVFVAHNALDKASNAKKEAKRLQYNQASNKADIAIYFDALDRFQRTLNEINSQYIASDEQLKDEIANELSLKLQFAHQQVLVSHADSDDADTHPSSN